MRGRTAGLWLAAGTLGAAQASTIVDYTLLRPEGQRHYLVVEPDGIKGSDGKQAWNDCRLDAASNASSDDVAFIASLIDTAVSELGADPERIYVYGSSNGGGMAYRLGIELAPRLAAIGVQSALMPMQSRCRMPTHPISVFVAHGTADEIAPYNGGKVGHWLLRDRGSGVSADESVAVWRRAAGLPETPMRFRLPHLQSSDPTSATRYVWGNDPARVQIQFMRIDGGGHVQPSKTEELPWLLRKIVGNMNHDVDTAEEAWNFFKDKKVSGLR